MKRVLFYFFYFSLCLCTSAVANDSFEKPVFTKQVLGSNAVLFTGNANPRLAHDVAQYLDVPLGRATVGRFNDGEIRISIEESVRNKEVYILQSTAVGIDQSVNDSLMELFLMIRTMKRASAKTIVAVIPYYGYARQDRKSAPRVPISAADVAMLLEEAGADRIVTLDLHCGQIQGFFRHAPVDNLYASTLFIPYFAKKQMKNIVIISPDAGGVERAKRFVDALAQYGIQARMAMLSKQRVEAGVIESMQLIGEVSGADVIIVDDICDTAGTLVQAAKLLKDRGAKHVFASITHPLFSGPALERIRHSAIDELVITDTVYLKKNMPSNIHCISAAPLLGEAIRRIHVGESVSGLF